MKKRKRLLQPKTCFTMGIIGAAIQIIEGCVMLVGRITASFLTLAAVALYGGMLLFLALGYKGDRGKNRRVKMLVLFLLLLAGGTVPVPVGPLANLFVVPLFLLVYPRPGDRPRLALLWVAEVVNAVATTIAGTIVAMSPGSTVLSFGAVQWVMIAGATLAVTAALRGWLLFLRVRPLEERNGKIQLADYMYFEDNPE